MAFPGDWNRRLAITIDHNDIDAGLSDWTLVFDQGFDSVLTSVDGPLDLDGAYPMQSDGGDIRFSSDEAGTTRLAVDVRTISPANDPSTGELELAIKIPSVSALADTTIYMWWGTSGTETQPAVGATYGQYDAYNTNYEGAYTFSEDPGPGTTDSIKDRTSNQEHGTPTSHFTSGDLVDGGVGKSITFGENEDEHIDLGNAFNFSGTRLYIEALAYLDAIIASRETAVMRRDRHFAMQLWPSEDTGSLRDLISATGTDGWIASNDVTFNWSALLDTWFTRTFRWTGSSIYSYVNGTQIGGARTVTGNIENTDGDPLFIGDGTNTQLYSFPGKISELRIAEYDFGAAWAKADHHNFVNTTGFLTWGTIEDVGGGGTAYAADLADSIGITDSITLSIGRFISLSDNVGITDTTIAAREIINLLQDNIGITDTALRSLGKYISLTESVAISETIAETVFQLVSVLLEDNVGISDSANLVGTYIRSLIDNVGISDTETSLRMLVRSLSENIGISDSMIGSLVLLISLIDTVGITDSLTTSIAAIINVALQDQVGISDVSTKVADYIRSFVESVGVTDDAESIATLIRSISDNIGISDSIVAKLILTVALTENVGITDSMTGTAFIQQIAELIEKDSEINLYIEKDSSINLHIEKDSLFKE